MDGHSCTKQDGCSTHVAQLRRLVWALLVWAFSLTVVLVVSIFLCVFQHKASSGMNPRGGIPSPLGAGNRSPSQEAGKGSPPLKNSLLVMYDYHNQHDKTAELIWQKVPRGNVFLRNLTVEEDGNYFLYLQVTVESTNTNVNYSIKVEKIGTTYGREQILEGHISNKQNSTGLMAKGLILSAGTNMSVTCQPVTNLSSKETYLGIIKL